MKHNPAPTCPDSYPRRVEIGGIDVSQQPKSNQLWPDVKPAQDWVDSDTGRKVPKPDWARD